MCVIATDEQNMHIKPGRAEITLQGAHWFLLCSPPFLSSVFQGYSGAVSGLWLSPSLLSGSEGCASLCTRNMSRAGLKTSWPTFLQSSPLQFRLALNIVGMWIPHVFLTFKMRSPMFYHLSLCCTENYLVLTSRLLAISPQFWTVSRLYYFPSLNPLIISPAFIIFTLMVILFHIVVIFQMYLKIVFKEFKARFL